MFFVRVFTPGGGCRESHCFGLCWVSLSVRLVGRVSSGLLLPLLVSLFFRLGPGRLVCLSSPRRSLCRSLGAPPPGLGFRPPWPRWPVGRLGPRSGPAARRRLWLCRRSLGPWLPRRPGRLWRRLIWGCPVALVAVLGSRSLPSSWSPAVAAVASAVVASGRALVSSCCLSGAAAAVRAAFPSALVFSATFAGRGALPARACSLLRAVAASGPGRAAVVFVVGACPSGIWPARSWRSGSPCSGSWSEAALSVGLGVPLVVVWAGSGSPTLPSWPAGAWSPVSLPGCPPGSAWSWSPAQVSF